MNDKMTSRDAELSRLNSDLNNLQMSTRQAIVVLGRDMSIRRFSQEAEKQFHLLANDVGRPFSSIRHDLVIAPRDSGGTGVTGHGSLRSGKDEQPTTASLTLDAFIAGVIADVREREVEVLDRNGCWFSLRVRPYFNLDNRVDGAVLVLVDIHALKQSARAIAAARDYAEAIVNTTPQPLLILDASLRVHTANDAFCRTFRVNAAETEGRLLYELGDGEWNIPLLRERLALLLANNEVAGDFTVEHDAPSIGPRILVLHVRQLQEHSEGGLRIILGIEDVTDRKREERTVAHLAAIVTSSDDAIISKSLDGIVLTWNRGAQALFGYTEEEAVGRPITFIIPPDRLDEEPQILARLRRGETVAHFETVRQRKDGALRDISLTISPIWNAAGELVGIAKTARDITEQREKDRALRESEQQYRQLTQELRTNDRRKNEFLAMLAHELRNPLAPLRSGLDALDQMDVQDAGRPVVRGMMRRQVQQMVRLIDDLLDVSRVSSGKITLRAEPVDLGQVVQHAVEVVQPMLEARQQQLSLDGPRTPLRVHGDPARLAQVVGNLLNNASKFSEASGHISLRVGRDDGYAVIEVADDGIGIAADDLSRVFDLFAQVDSSLGRNASGLGLGLTLVRALVELHGGTVTARSEGLGAGTSFTVRLPVLEHAPSPAMPHQPLVPAGSSIGRKVLVIDDNRDAAETLTMLLGLSGYDTCIAHDGLEGLAAAVSFLPDVILLDIGLPALDGYEVARRIRRESWGERIRLVALTGWGQREDRRKSMEAGFDTHLVKPVDIAVLLELLAEPGVATSGARVE